MCQLKESHKRIKIAVQASGTSLTELYGDRTQSWPAELIGLHRRRHVGSPAETSSPPTPVSHPIEVSSGGRTVHRLSRRGNRQLNHAIHMVAICQIRQTDSEGRDLLREEGGRG